MPNPSGNLHQGMQHVPRICDLCGFVCIYTLHVVLHRKNNNGKVENKHHDSPNHATSQIFRNLRVTFFLLAGWPPDFGRPAATKKPCGRCTAHANPEKNSRRTKLQNCTRPWLRQIPMEPLRFTKNDQENPWLEWSLIQKPISTLAVKTRRLLLGMLIDKMLNKS